MPHEAPIITLPSGLVDLVSRMNKVERNRLRFVCVGEMFKNYKPAPWLIDDSFKKNSISLVFGESTAGKSVIDWACCIATGKRFEAALIPWQARSSFWPAKALAGSVAAFAPGRS